MSYGFVYVIGNPCTPGIYKIGMTTRSPSQRCKELSASTSAASSFVLLAYYEFEDVREIERRMHMLFDDERVSANREFFRCSLYCISENLRGISPLSFYESTMVQQSGMGEEPFGACHDAH